MEADMKESGKTIKGMEKVILRYKDRQTSI